MSVRKEYRVNGVDGFIIDYVRQWNGTYKIYARQHPADPYGRSASYTHLFGNGQICIASGREPRSLDAAKTIAGHWMESYSNYTRTGQMR
ncbi:MAG: hypothetical protein KDA80_24670 [Planctomycetaceae bacterium]|nr:hypothetical protein [Planctomycetaceae bacterium]